MSAPKLARCRTCRRLTDARRRHCGLCGAPWQLARWQRITIEAAAASWAGWFVLLAVLLAGAAS